VNLLLINYEYPPLGGGAGNATMFLSRALHRLGHPTAVLTSAWGEQRGICDDHGVAIHRLPVSRREANRASAGEMFGFVRAALAAAPEVARRHRAEAVIVFFTLPCGPVALRLHRRLGLPYLVSLRGGDVPGLVPEIAWQHRLLTPLRRRILRAATAIVANDAGLADLSRRADPFPVEVVHNGVDTDFFRPAASSRPGSKPTEILFVGRLHRQKNLLFFLEQLARLHAAEPGAWQFTVVGDGEERRTLELAAETLGVGSITSWLGWQKDKQDLVRRYQQADLVINPSLYEGMPNVVLEAMACGRPVVASDIPGNNTLVRSGETGLLFPLGDGAALRRALATLRHEPVAARRLGENARRRMEAEFSWAHVAQSYLELLRAGI
jgi:glycosyltransferase involved in cell wall biosynthesis